MGQNRAGWLPHVTGEIVADARGWNLDAYAVALEGWRRGLTLQWHVKESEKFNEMETWFVDTPGRLFSLSSKHQTHYFFRTRGDLVTNEAVKIGSDKEQTKQALIQAEVATPNGKQFKEDVTDDEIIHDVVQHGFPVVLKPTDGSFGRGVITNINNEVELKSALQYVRGDQNFRDVIIEQHIPGEDYRIYVVGDQVVAAMKRIPANVIGDGSHSIAELIQLKNEDRKQNPRLISCLIQVDDELTTYIQSQGYMLEDVLAAGEQLFLSKKSNISTGGDPISVTDEIPEEIKKTAVQALQAIPGLAHGAVDLIVDSRKAITEAATIIELNPTAQIGGLLFPVEGKASDVPAAIIDYYFPETKDVVVDKTRFYFDFVDVLSPLVSHSTESTTVTPMPVGKVYAKKYTVIGDVADLGFHMGLRKQAFERRLSGLVLQQEDGNISVVVAGTDPKMVAEFKDSIWEDKERATVTEIHEHEWEAPMRVGFEVRADLRSQANHIEQLIQQIDETERELKQAERKQRKLYQSLSWKITAPVRLIGKLFGK